MTKVWSPTVSFNTTHNKQKKLQAAFTQISLYLISTCYLHTSRGYATVHVRRLSLFSVGGEKHGTINTHTHSYIERERERERQRVRKREEQERRTSIYSEDYEGSGLKCWPGCRERSAGGRPGYIVLQSSAQGGEAPRRFVLHVRLRVDGQRDGRMDGMRRASSDMGLSVVFWWNR